MRNTINYKTVFRLVILIFLSVTLSVLYLTPVRTQHGERLIPIATTKHLQPVNAIIPVELQCSTVRLSSPSTLEQINCGLKNNSPKSLTAANVTYSVIVATAGGDHEQSANCTLDDPSRFQTLEYLGRPRRANICRDSGSDFLS